MSVITLRNMDPDLELELRRQAEEEGSSLNKVVQKLLHQALGTKTSSRRWTDLDHHFGVWSREEAEEFESTLEEHSQIDHELWS